MTLVLDQRSADQCPHCAARLTVEATWECDGEPYPLQICECPKCNGDIRVEQYVITKLSPID